MNIKVILYVICVLLSIFVLNGVNFNNIIKKNKELEAKMLYLTLSFIMGYLLANFIYDFINVSQIL